MSAKVTWLIVFVLLYWAYCIFWGVRGAQLAKTASDYFISGRKLPMWVFVLAATATSFSGWTFMGHPGLIYRDGFQYAYASFYVITIPFTGVMFLKRQWILGKRFGYVTPGEMLADYFKGDMVRVLTVVVALCFSVPYLGLQLAASGKLFNVLSDGIMGCYNWYMGTSWYRGPLRRIRRIKIRGLRGYTAMCTFMVWNCSNWFYYRTTSLEVGTH